MVGIVILTFAAIPARSVALAGFGLDSLIEIGASIVVVWELSGRGLDRQRRALRMIGVAFAVLIAYLLVQSTVVLVTGFRPHHSPTGIAWTAITAAVMFALAAGKARTGTALGNPILAAEGRVTLIDAILAATVLLGLLVNTVLGWWWAADRLRAGVLRPPGSQRDLCRITQLPLSRRFTVTPVRDPNRGAKPVNIGV